MPIAWKDEYSVGVAQIDDQHRQLFKFINGLESLIQEGIHSGPKVDNIIMFLTTYTKTHFAFEESCMFKYACPVSKKNKEAHKHFLQYYQEAVSHYENEGSSLEWLQKLYDRMSDWLVSHICQVDTHLKACVRH